VVLARVAADAVGGTSRVDPVAAAAGVHDVDAVATEHEVGCVLGHRRLARLGAHRVGLHVAGVDSGVAEDRRRAVRAVDAVASGAADEQLRAAARTRQDGHVASLAEGVVDRAGGADRGGGRHDVVVTRAAVDAVGAQAAGEDVVRAAAEDRRLLRRGRRRGDEVEAVGAVDGV